jgi:hypothetical protein
MVAHTWSSDQGRLLSASSLRASGNNQRSPFKPRDCHRPEFLLWEESMKAVLLYDEFQVLNRGLPVLHILSEHLLDAVA